MSASVKGKAIITNNGFRITDKLIKVRDQIKSRSLIVPFIVVSFAVILATTTYFLVRAPKGTGTEDDNSIVMRNIDRNLKDEEIIDCLRKVGLTVFDYVMSLKIREGKERVFLWLWRKLCKRL